MCKSDRLKRILTHDLHTIEKKQMKLLQDKAKKDERTGFLELKNSYLETQPCDVIGRKVQYCLF